ncbi:MAG: bifunctional oligoribonuclease/PAP phosphatase NrnA [Planctomycetota bacterium]
MLSWHELDRWITEAESILLTTHVRPDGDALGSELAFADLLIQRGKEVEIFNASPTPERYRFLDPVGDRVHFLRLGNEKPKIDPDLIIILDTGTWSQLAGLADYVRQSKARKVVIDHHVSQDELGALRLVDTSAAACGMLVHQAFVQFKQEITPHAAKAMFVAIATDTGWMRHSNCSPQVLETLAHLVAGGAQPHEVYRNIFEQNRLERLRLMCVMIDRIELRAEGRLATSYVLWEDIIAAKAHPMETEDFINYPLTVKGVETAILFIGQVEGGTKVSFRSRGGLNVAEIAEQFGGGGHRPAAGASMTLSVKEAMEAVIPATERAMHQ